MSWIVRTRWEHRNSLSELFSTIMVWLIYSKRISKNESMDQSFRITLTDGSSLFSIKYKFLRFMPTILNVEWIASIYEGEGSEWPSRRLFLFKETKHAFPLRSGEWLAEIFNERDVCQTVVFHSPTFSKGKRKQYFAISNSF